MVLDNTVSHTKITSTERREEKEEKRVWSHRVLVPQAPRHLRRLPRRHQIRQRGQEAESRRRRGLERRVSGDVVPLARGARRAARSRYSDRRGGVCRRRGAEHRRVALGAGRRHYISQGRTPAHTRPEALDPPSQRLQHRPALQPRSGYHGRRRSVDVVGNVERGSWDGVEDIDSPAEWRAAVIPGDDVPQEGGSVEAWPCPSARRRIWISNFGTAGSERSASMGAGHRELEAGPRSM
ncbi:hypothetical protein C8J57DRAFT_758476 [Mycena rebaudengoi]|nr:hypothetical protein C8J57DRAFT_758476 [Mycena rebaudengoi]